MQEFQVQTGDKQRGYSLSDGGESSYWIFIKVGVAEIS